MLHIISTVTLQITVWSDAGGLGETVGGLAESAFVDVGDQDLRTLEQATFATAADTGAGRRRDDTACRDGSRPGGGVGILASRWPSPPYDVRDQR